MSRLAKISDKTHKIVKKLAEKERRTIKTILDIAVEKYERRKK